MAQRLEITPNHPKSNLVVGSNWVAVCPFGKIPPLFWTIFRRALAVAPIQPKTHFSFCRTIHIEYQTNKAMSNLIPIYIYIEMLIFVWIFQKARLTPPSLCAATIIVESSWNKSTIILLKRWLLRIDDTDQMCFEHIDKPQMWIKTLIARPLPQNWTRNMDLELNSACLARIQIERSAK